MGDGKGVAMSQDVIDATTAQDAIVRSSKRWTAAGVIVLLGSVALYVTSLSRSTGLWIAPIGLAYLVVGNWCTRNHRRAPRWVFILMAVVTSLAVILGALTFIYSNLITHPHAV